MMSDDTENLLTSLQNHVSMMDEHQKRRHGGKLLVRALSALQNQFGTAAVEVNSEGHALLLCSALLKASQWFQITPFPDGLWEVRVKEENHDRIRILLKHLAGTDNGNT